MRQALTYDDIQLIPNYSDVQSRQNIKLTTAVSRNWSIDIPIVGSCMDTVTEFVEEKQSLLAVFKKQSQ